MRKELRKILRKYQKENICESLHHTTLYEIRLLLSVVDSEKVSQYLLDRLKSKKDRQETEKQNVTLGNSK